MAKILDGKEISGRVKNELKEAVLKMVQGGHRPPHLVAVLVGENPASQSYVRNKIRFCEEVGYRSTLMRLSAEVSQAELLEVVYTLNKDEEVDGFIVQLPLPDHINEAEINLAIDFRKDVDGFHPMNFGRMAQGFDAYLPATPAGILEMLKRSDIQTSGKTCVVVGRSNIVGTPISILLSRKGNPGNCTVTLTHSRTSDIKSELLKADIIIAAIGIPGFVKADMVKEGAIVIDVGINQVEDTSHPRGYRLVGDVDFENVKEISSYITPVPGGVGPMTVTALMINTMKAATKEIYQ